MSFKFVDIILITLTAILYALGYFFRGSVAPITDVLETEFNATSGDIGLMSSLFWAGYFLLQIPSGLLLQHLSTEFVVLISAILFAITSGLFGLPFNKDNIILPSIIMFIAGTAIAPIFLAVLSLISQRLGRHYLPYIGGMVFFATTVFLFCANLLQAFLYQEFEIWREVFWTLSSIVIIIFIVLYIINIIDNRNKFKQMRTKTKSGYDEYIEQSTDTPMSILSGNDTDKLLTDSKTKKEPVFFGGIVVKYKEDKDEGLSVWKSMKNAFMNPWNYIMGFHWFSVAAIMTAFNGLWLISYMSLKFGYSRELSTFISGLFYIAHAFGNIIMGKLSTKFQRKKIFFMICSVCLLSPIYIIYCSEDVNMFVIILMNILSGFGTGVPSITFAFVREYNDYYECSDVAGGVVNTIASSSGFFVQWLIGILIDYNWKQREGGFDEKDERDYNVDDYNLGFITILIVIGMNVILTLIMKETKSQKVSWDESKPFFVRFFC